MRGIAEAVAQLPSARIEGGAPDVVGEDGLIVCGRCGSPKQVRVERAGGPFVARCMCECETRAEEERREAERAKVRECSIRAMPADCLNIAVSDNSEFGLCDCARREMGIVRAYAARFAQAERGGHGLALIGPPGTGKTVAAECLTNYLRHDGRAVLFTSVERAESELWDVKGREHERILESIGSYSLVVIDDLGSERSSEYMDSKAFELVDARYRSGRPLVVTTNEPLAKMKDPRNLSRLRIYDRVLERCQPVIFDGPSWRIRKSEENRDELRRILGEQER